MKHLRIYEKFEKVLNLNLYDLCVSLGSMKNVIEYLRYLADNSYRYEINGSSFSGIFQESEPISDEFGTTDIEREAIYIPNTGNVSYGFIMRAGSRINFTFYNVEYDNTDFEILMNANKYNL